MVDTGTEYKRMSEGPRHAAKVSPARVTLATNILGELTDLAEA